MTTKIIIPDEYYAGMRSSRDEIPVAFLTPNGTDKSALNRISTVNNWSKGYGQLDSVIIKNTPLYGFRLTSSIRRGGQYGTGDKWYIEDPRGFQLEISSSNLAYIMQYCIIEKGTILDSCVWARQNGNNVLLATSTDLYQTAEKFTNLGKKTESIKNVKLGNKIILQNGIHGVYLGKYHLLQRSWRQQDVLEWHKPQHIIVQYNNNNQCEKVHIISVPKISEILDKNEISSKEAEETINELLTTKKDLVDVYAPALAAVAKKPIKMQLDLAIDPDHINALDTKNDITYAVELKSGDIGLYNYYEGNLIIKLVDTSNAAQGKLSWIYQPRDPNKNYYYRNPDMREKTFKLSSVKNVYKIMITIKTKLGNEVFTEL